MPVCLVTRVEDGVACTVYSIRHRVAGRLDISQASLACLLGAWHTWCWFSLFNLEDCHSRTYFAYVFGIMPLGVMPLL